MQEVQSVLNLVKKGEEDHSKEGEDNPSGSLKTYQYRETSILTSFSGILFAFLLRIATTIPKDASIFSRVVLLIAIYCSCIAICSFIMPILSTKLHIYDKVDLEKYIKRTELSMRVGSIAAIVSVYFGLGISLNGLFNIEMAGLLNIEMAYIFAALPFIIIGFVIWKR